MSKPIFVLALDGVPYTLLIKLISHNVMPNLAQLITDSQFRQMNSVLPPVSSVAWASFMTGKNPSDHGIWGFVDRDPASMDWFVPLSDRLNSRTLWEHLSDHNKRSFVMNVPLTYPPRKINGISICGFLGDDITKGTHPEEIGYLLKARGYQIDADTELAKTDLMQFYSHLLDILDKRLETMWYFFDRQPWDFFLTHIMETDRLHHFFWEYYETKHEVYHGMFLEFYRKLDKEIAKIVEKTRDRMELIILSDHGFTTLDKEVYLNKWLNDHGYLSFRNNNPKSLHDITPSSKAYSFYPGRIYINLAGREKSGSVQPGIEYDRIVSRLTKDLLGLTDPANGGRVIKEVVPRHKLNSRVERIFNDTNGLRYDDNLPDLIAVANSGYDLKGSLISSQLFRKTHFNGVHTFDDAFIIARDIKLPDQKLSISQIAGLILKFINVPLPADIELV